MFDPVPQGIKGGSITVVHKQRRLMDVKRRVKFVVLLSREQWRYNEPYRLGSPIQQGAPA